MFNKIGSNSSNSIERTKDTKVMRKSMPGPETLTSVTSLGSNASNSTTASNSRGQTKSSSDIPNEPPNAHWMHYQNQMRLHPQQYIPQQPPQSRSHSQPRYATRPNEMYEYIPSAMMRPGSRVGIAGKITNNFVNFYGSYLFLNFGQYFYKNLI